MIYFVLYFKTGQPLFFGPHKTDSSGTREALAQAVAKQQHRYPDAEVSLIYFGPSGPYIAPLSWMLP